MITEVVPLTATDGDQFVSAFKEVEGSYYAQDGVLSHRLIRSAEEPNQFLAIVDWASKDSYDAALVTEVGKAFLGRIGPLMVNFPAISFFHAA